MLPQRAQIVDVIALQLHTYWLLKGHGKVASGLIAYRDSNSFVLYREYLLDQGLALISENLVLQVKLTVDDLLFLLLDIFFKMAAVSDLIFVRAEPVRALVSLRGWRAASFFAWRFAV
jgi:hypothetical protein